MSELTIAEVVAATKQSDKTIRRALEAGELREVAGSRPVRIERLSYERYRANQLAKVGIPADQHLGEELIRLEAEVHRLDDENAALRSKLSALGKAHELVVSALTA